MVIKQRAILGEDKENRRGTILAAAEQLLLADPSRLPSVDEVAKAAGLAKGTVYLYFNSKEELLLGIQARNTADFFAELVICLNRPGPFYLEDLLPVLHRHWVQNEGYLPLAVRCFAVMDKDVPIESVVATKTRVAAWLNESAVAMVRHWPQITHEEAVNVMVQTYGLALGMWQLMHPVERMSEHMRNVPELKMFARPFWLDLSKAIVALWRGHLGDRVNLPSKVDSNKDPA